MSIKQMVNRRMDKWGTKVLHVSSSKYIKCKCYDNVTKQGNASCTICLGAGKITSINAIDVIIDISVNREYEQQTGFGMDDNTPVQVYTKYNTALKQRDKLLVVGFRDGLPMDVKDVFVINNPNVYRMNESAIQGHVCTATKLNSEIKIYQRYLNTLSVEAKKNIMDGSDAHAGGK